METEATATKRCEPEASQIRLATLLVPKNPMCKMPANGLELGDPQLAEQRGRFGTAFITLLGEPE